MPYEIVLSDGATTLVTVPDRLIVGPLQLNTVSNCSLNLIGRGARDYGLALATDMVWLLENFASDTPPPDPLPGQLWYNTTGGNSALQLYSTENTWLTVSVNGASGTDQTISDGLGDQLTLGANGVITLIRADGKPRVTFATMANASNAVTLQLGTDAAGAPDLTLNCGTFASAAPAALWHAQNLAPVVQVAANQAISGNVAVTGALSVNGYAVLTMSAGPPRTRLNAALNLYVATTGSDSNGNGTSGYPFATLLKAWTTIRDTYDIAGFQVTVNVAAGSYQSLQASGAIVGSAGVADVSFVGTNATVVADPVALTCFTARQEAAFQISGFTMVGNGVSNAIGLSVGQRSCVVLNGPCTFGAFPGTASYHMVAGNGGIIFQSASYTITGAAAVHLDVYANGLFTQSAAYAVTIPGSVAFSYAFLTATTCGVVTYAAGSTFGTATGTRFLISTNAVCVTNTSGPNLNLLPGSAAGVQGSGGQYV